jgi:hypothetical protein
MSRMKRCDDIFGQHGNAVLVPLPAPDADLPSPAIDVFDSQADALDSPEPRTVYDLYHQLRFSLPGQVGEKGLNFSGMAVFGMSFVVKEDKPFEPGNIGLLSSP